MAKCTVDCDVCSKKNDYVWSPYGTVVPEGWRVVSTSKEHLLTCSEACAATAFLRALDSKCLPIKVT